MTKSTGCTSMNSAVATVGATRHANWQFTKKSASSPASSARRELSRRHALETLSPAPFLISGAHCVMPKMGLVLQGGGALGAYEYGAVTRLVELGRGDDLTI